MVWRRPGPARNSPTESQPEHRTVDKPSGLAHLTGFHALGGTRHVRMFCPEAVTPNPYKVAKIKVLQRTGSCPWPPIWSLLGFHCLPFSIPLLPHTRLFSG